MSLDWTPPPGMDPKVAAAWRVFYAKLLTGAGKEGAYIPVTPSMYRDQYIAQHGCCYICRVAKGKHPDDPKGRGGRRLGVDHNHLTGRFRGLLCTGGDRTCNRIIGWLKLAALERAVTYLREEPAQIVMRKVQYLDRQAPQEVMDAMLRNTLGLK